jgi:alpha-D-ribose 1-methylphosphonate 5-triphosphate diphosphatase
VSNNSTAITNAFVITPGRVLEDAALGIRDGHIAEVAEDGRLQGDYESWVDAHGAHVMPGVIDLHNDSLEVEINPRPETNLAVEFALANLERRLMFSGVTTEFHAIAFMDNARARRTAAQAGERAAFLAGYNRSGSQLVDHQILHRLDVWSPASLDMIFESLERLDVRYVSINDHTPGQGQYRDLDGYKERMVQWAERRGGGKEFTAEAIEERMRERATDNDTIPQVYRRIWEEQQRLGFTISSHDDDSPEKVDALCDLGASMSEFPVDVPSARQARERGMRIIVGAPNIVRGGSSSGNQSAIELFALGLADIICADYHAPSMLPAAFGLVDDNVVDLPTAMRALTLNPARAVNLYDRGAIEPGLSADVILVRRTGRSFPAVERVFRKGIERMSLNAQQPAEVPA